MSSFPSDSNYNSNSIIDSETYNCKRCLMNNVTNSVKQYYVNLDTTMNMCCICKDLYLMENAVTVNTDVRKSVSSKSLKKKMSLLPFLLKKEPDETLTQEEAKQILDNAFHSYKRSLAREEDKVNDLLSLVSQLLPNLVRPNPPTQNTEMQAALQSSANLDDEDVFYFSNGLTIPKTEITDFDIEAAISALSCNNSSGINYQDMPDIDYDSFLAYSDDLDNTLPILSDETLLSPIYYNEIDKALKHLNENQDSGIKINVNFDALQKILATPKENETQKSSNEQPRNKSKKVERFLSKTNLRACDLLRKSQQMHLWKEKSEGSSLSQQSKGLDLVSLNTKEGIVNSLKSGAETGFDCGKFETTANTSAAKSSSSQNSLVIYNGQNSDCYSSGFDSIVNSYCKEGRKMYGGFEFEKFKREVKKSPVNVKPKKKKTPFKANTATLSLIEELRKKKPGS